MFRWTPLIAAALACSGSAKDGEPATDSPSPPTTSDTGWVPTTDSGTTVPGDARVDEVQNAYDHVVTVQRVPGTAAAVAVGCDAGDDEQLLWEFPSGDVPLVLVGLLGDTPYDCTLVDLGSDEHTPFSVRMRANDAPTATVERHPTLAPSSEPYLLVNTNEQCLDALTPTLRLYDLDGRPRWAHHLEFDVNLATEARYHGDGLVVWGGGYTDRFALQYLQLDHTVLETLGAEVAPDAIHFHHDGKLLDDGTELMLAETYNTDGNTTWLGWRAIGRGGSWSGELDSQVLFDAGLLPPGASDEDAYHANWVDLVDGVLYVSQCFTDEILALDPTTGALHWRIGPGPDSLKLVDAAGAPLAADAWPQCQHGLEVIGDQLLVYDNGRYPDRDFSRAMSLQVDPSAGTAEVEWVYAEPEWFDNAMGDIDDLGAGRVLIHMAHVECWGLFPDQTTAVELDTASQQVMWRMAFDDPYVASYRAERVDACDAIPHATYCPGVAERLGELGL